jgi:hypothetical protein
MIKKLFAKKNVIKAVAMLMSISFLSSTFACIPSINEITGKGNDNTQANIIGNTGNEDDGENGEDDNSENETDVKKEYTHDFSVKNEASFAARVQGVYKLTYDDSTSENGDEADAHEVEIYAVGDNLYAMYSGLGYIGVEFFPAGDIGFDSEVATSIKVNAVSFSSQSNMGHYFNNGYPTETTITIDGDNLIFDDCPDRDFFILDNCKLERIDRDMGYLGNFDYKSDIYKAEKLAKDAGITTIDTPKELIGGWMILGDIDAGVAFEFTEDGLVQSYLKNMDEEVSLFRGTYVVAENKDKGCYDILMSMMKFGEGSHPYQYKISFNWYEDGTDSFTVTRDDTLWDEDAIWEGAMLFKMENPAEVMTAGINTSEEYLSRPRMFGHYVSSDGWSLMLDGREFRIFNAANPADATIWYEGYLSKGDTNTELILYPDMGEDDTTYYGYLVENDDYSIDVYEASTGKTKKYK